MKNLINPNIIGLNPYIPGIPLEEIKEKYNLEKVVKLASNENPFTLPRNVSEIIQKEIISLNRYPDSDSHALLKKIARYHGLDKENVIVGSGSVEIIKMIVRTFLKPGQRILSSRNTFVMFKISTVEQAGNQAYVEAEMDEGYGYDLDNMLKRVDETIKIIFIANPNNPTGTMLPRQKVLDFIEKIPPETFVILDNAYEEYVSDPQDHLSGINLAVNRKNIIVLRTFSKIYALAGLRIGYGISNEKTIYYLNQIRPPFNVTRMAQKAAQASLENDDFKLQSARLNQKNKSRLFNQLTDMGFRVIPSQTNFLLFFPEKNVNELHQRLLKEGVIIRPLQAFGIPDGIRLTIGFEEDNDFFIKKLKKVLAELD
jgi:histidinol-phosphate aminotransferase